MTPLSFNILIIRFMTTVFNFKRLLFFGTMAIQLIGGVSVVVLQVDTETIKKMQHFYQDNLKDTYPAHSIFSAVTNGVTITVYQSGKALFQGANASEEAKIWEAFSTTFPQKNTKKSSTALPENFQQWSVIGSDEVGNGSYFGPLVVVSAFVSQNMIAKLTNLGIKDSKLLTDSKIKELAHQLKQLIPHVILHVTPEKYNQIQPTMSQGQMKAELHNHALLKIKKKIDTTEVDAILIDQFELPKTYWNHLSHKKDIVRDNVYFATKGESEHLAVAVASIIARSEFLEALDHLSHTTGITLPSGAGSNVDKVAATIIREKSLNTLQTVAKWHFANTQKAITLAQKTDN